MPPHHITTCQDRQTARLTTDHAQTCHRERRTDHVTGTCHDHRQTCRQPQARHDHMHRHAHVTWITGRDAQAHTYDRTCAHKYHTTRHTSTHTPRGRGYPRDKSKAAGPLVLTLNASQTIFELRVTHEIFTRIGHATVVAPVGVSRIHFG